MPAGAKSLREGWLGRPGKTGGSFTVPKPCLPRREGSIQSPATVPSVVSGPCEKLKIGDPLKIIVNDSEMDVPAATSVTGLLLLLAVERRAVAVERNLELVPADRFDSCLLGEGDRLEVVTLAGGG